MREPGASSAERARGLRQCLRHYLEHYKVNDRDYGTVAEAGLCKRFVLPGRHHLRLSHRVAGAFAAVARSPAKFFIKYNQANAA